MELADYGATKTFLLARERRTPRHLRRSEYLSLCWNDDHYSELRRLRQTLGADDTVTTNNPHWRSQKYHSDISSEPPQSAERHHSRDHSVQGVTSEVLRVRRGEHTEGHETHRGEAAGSMRDEVGVP
ncbi:unnamed protein product [Danaus chrysippus]|uniref:(African queen) hypothetical protein n=1 Tax=Danaus chrysippus TaxID=151541 RepID=A0A8J2QHL1_9NEOP|nr:unnamed protein product [Danaus chrysippus]